MCLQRCLSDIFPYAGSPLYLSLSVFRDRLLRSLLFLFFSHSLSLSFETSLCRISALCLPVCLQRPVTQICALSLFLSSPLSLSRDPYVGSPLSVSPSVFRDLLLRSLLLLFSSLPLSLFEELLLRSPLSVSPSVFRDLLLRSLLSLFSFLYLFRKSSV